MTFLIFSAEKWKLKKNNKNTNGAHSFCSGLDIFNLCTGGQVKKPNQSGAHYIKHEAKIRKEKNRLVVQGPRTLKKKGNTFTYVDGCDSKFWTRWVHVVFWPPSAVRLGFMAQKLTFTRWASTPDVFDVVVKRNGNEHQRFELFGSRFVS